MTMFPTCPRKITPRRSRSTSTRTRRYPTSLKVPPISTTLATSTRATTSTTLVSSLSRRTMSVRWTTASCSLRKALMTPAYSLTRALVTTATKITSSSNWMWRAKSSSPTSMRTMTRTWLSSVWSRTTSRCWIGGSCLYSKCLLLRVCILEKSKRFVRKQWAKRRSWENNTREKLRSGWRT